MEKVRYICRVYGHSYVYKPQTPMTEAPNWASLTHYLVMGVYR
jgi:hypothetical protein